MNRQDQPAQRDRSSRPVVILSLMIGVVALAMAISQSPSHTGAEATITYYHFRENQGTHHRKWHATTVVRIENTSDFIARDVAVTIDPLPDAHEIMCNERVDVSEGPQSAHVASIGRVLPRSTVELEIRVWPVNADAVNTGAVNNDQEKPGADTWCNAPTIRQVSYRSTVVACDHARCQADVTPPPGLLPVGCRDWASPQAVELREIQDAFRDEILLARDSQGPRMAADLSLPSRSRYAERHPPDGLFLFLSRDDSPAPGTISIDQQGHDHVSTSDPDSKSNQRGPTRLEHHRSPPERITAASNDRTD